MKNWKLNNPDYFKIWYQNHSDYNKIYYQNNRDKILENHKEYYLKRELVLKRKKMISKSTDLMSDISSIFWGWSKPESSIYPHAESIKSAIAIAKGIHDSRTIKKWFNRLIEHRFIIQWSYDPFDNRLLLIKILNHGLT